jgi:hypothetical protein
MVIGARKREVGMSVLGRVPQCLLVASSGRAVAGDRGQDAVTTRIAKIICSDGGTVSQRRFGARRRGRPGIQ